jgi:hypothetical protein
MGYGGADGFHQTPQGGSGGIIGGGGSLGTVAMFTPDGTDIGDSTIKILPTGISIEVVPGNLELTTGAKLTTTNNTTTTLQTIPVPLNSAVLIAANIVCRKTAGAGVGTVGEANGYVRTTVAKNVAGVVTLGTIQSSYTSEDIGAFNATFQVSGTNVLVRVTGSANNTVDWSTITKSSSV